MKKNHLIILITTLLLAVSCTVKPKEISYGNDHCHFCDMTIVDETHSAQYVTKKGKPFVFDAIECLVSEISEQKNEDKMELVLVANFNDPGNLINATSAYFLISEKIKSPMGANLSAFNSQDDAVKAQNNFGGEVYSWEELKVKFND